MARGRRLDARRGARIRRKGETYAYDSAVLDVSLHLLLIVGDGGDGIVGEEHVSLWEGWRDGKAGELVGACESIS